MDVQDEPVRRAVIYTRISRDRDGQSAGVQRQEVDCRALAAKRGLDVVRVYTDNDVGASSMSRKPRPEFEQMLRDAESGAFEVVVAYSNSRLTRRPMEFEKLLALSNEPFGIRFITVVSGEDDLSTSDGALRARILASVDAAEAERTGERLKAAHWHMAMAGKPFLGGDRAFGWESDKVTIVEEEADLIRRAVSSVTLGTGSLTGIAGAWNMLGVRTTKGNEWRHTTLRGLLTHPRLAGYRTHKDKILRRDDGEAVRGTWAPILTEEQRDGLLVALDDRKVSRRRATRYLLTPYLMCGRCGARMYGNRKDDGKTFYRCSRTWHLTINASQLELAVGNAVGVRLGKLSEYGRTHGDAGNPKPVEKPEFAGAARRDDLQQQNQELMARYNSGQMKGERVFPQVEANDREIDKLLSEERRWNAEELKASRTTLRLVEGFDLSLWWKTFSDESREVLTTLAVDRIVVRPTGKGRSLSVEDRVDIQWSWAVTPWPEGEEPPVQPSDIAWLEAEAKHAARERTAKRVSGNQHDATVMKLLSLRPEVTGQEVADELALSRSYAQKLLRRARSVAPAEVIVRPPTSEVTG